MLQNFNKIRNAKFHKNSFGNSGIDICRHMELQTLHSYWVHLNFFTELCSANTPQMFIRHWFNS